MGSNVGDSKQYVLAAQEMLLNVLECPVSAPLYRSKAVGVTDQADFLNTVVRGLTNLSPEELLRFVKDVEVKVGRIERFRWGPREIDIDIILFGDTVMDQNNLTIPHPRFAERDFVLKPLCDLDAALIDPVSKLTVEALLQKLPPNNLSVLQTI